MPPLGLAVPNQPKGHHAIPSSRHLRGAGHLPLPFVPMTHQQNIARMWEAFDYYNSVGNEKKADRILARLMKLGEYVKAEHLNTAERS